MKNAGINSSIRALTGEILGSSDILKVILGEGKEGWVLRRKNSRLRRKCVGGGVVKEKEEEKCEVKEDEEEICEDRKRGGRDLSTYVRK